MFFYICSFEKNRINNDLITNHSNNSSCTVKDIDKKSIIPSLEGYDFKGQEEIDGIICIKRKVVGGEKEVNFKLRTGSGFAFIETDLELYKLKSLDCLNDYFDINISEFIPRRDKIVDFISNLGELISANLFTMDGIKTIQDIDDSNKTNEEILMDYPLAKADINIKSPTNNFRLQFYGDAIQFPDFAKNEDLEFTFELFEKAMSNYQKISESA